ncbi:MAG: imelysin family protein [Marinobacter sp.]|uniref:imelysin family protein n=1 Tax=Marinobacter sp. TaxID=50741 RepID=UPI00299E6E75|nr:imelysin family protein [Marinobacter sp.]MDX1757543.1 imelysin family protein [Marinobacter sp.]
MLRSALPPLLALALVACGPAPDEPTPQPPSAPAAAPQLVERSNRLCRAVDDLQQAVTGFLAAPGEAPLVTARSAWHDAHDAYRLVLSDYQQAGVLPPQIHEDRDPIDAYPMLPGYLDQVPGYPRSGLIYSEVPLTPDVLADEHQSTDFHYLTLGFHPLEFMLWGNPGESVSDQTSKFVAGQSPESGEAIDVAERRHDLTRLIAVALQRHSRQLCQDAEQRRLTAALSNAQALDTLVTSAEAVAHENTGDTSPVSEEARE